jgi:hypothetical protein
VFHFFVDTVYILANNRTVKYVNFTAFEFFFNFG